MDERWYRMPEQQARVIGDPEAPGPDTPGPGEPGGPGEGGDPTTGPGPEDPSEGFTGPGGAADSPTRGGPTGPARGGEGGPRSPHTPPRDPRDNPLRSPTEVDLKRSLAEKYGIDEDDFEVTIGFDKRTGKPELGMLAKNAARQSLLDRLTQHLTPQQKLVNRITDPRTGPVGFIGNMLANHFGQAFSAQDGRPLGNDPGPEQTGGEVAANEEDDKKPPEPGDDDNGETDPQYPWVDPEQAQREREEAERIIGGLMPDLAFDVPDWGVIQAQAAAPGVDPAQAAIPVHPNMAQMEYDQAYGMMVEAILGDEV